MFCMKTNLDSNILGFYCDKQKPKNISTSFFLGCNKQFQWVGISRRKVETTRKIYQHKEKVREPLFT